MLTTWQLSRLIDPVICRAQATNEASSSGFVDRASSYVLMQLERDEPIHDRTHWRQYKQQLQRWQWIDHAVMGFFKQYIDTLVLAGSRPVTGFCRRTYFCI